MAALPKLLSLLPDVEYLIRGLSCGTRDTIESGPFSSDKQRSCTWLWNRCWIGSLFLHIPSIFQKDILREKHESEVTLTVVAVGEHLFDLL